MFLEMLREYQTYGLIAFVVTVFATPLAIRLARRYGIMDFPDQQLKPHAKPTPYLGGAAICLGWTVAVATALLWADVEWRSSLPILLGGIAISGLGLIDDVKEISVKRRRGIGA